jgi:hypothetical protein
LGAGESFTVNDLPYGYGYSIIEEGASYYVTDIKTSNSLASIDTNNKSISKPHVYEDTTVTYNNTAPLDLNISKVVENFDESNKDIAYDFSIEITTSNGEKIKDCTLTAYINGFKNWTSLTFVDGKATFSLKNGECIMIQNQLPIGYSYKITEQSSDDYTTRITASSGSTINNDTRTVSKSSVAENESITFTNTYTNKTEEIVPTGIRIDVLPYLIMLVICFGALVGFTIIRRKGR